MSQSPSLDKVSPANSSGKNLNAKVQETAASGGDSKQTAENSDPSNEVFTYAYVQPHLLVRTVELHVNILPQLQPSAQPDQNQAQQPQGSGAAAAAANNAGADAKAADSKSKKNVDAEGELITSEIEPFRMPLPLPPNCRLYRQLNKNPNVRKMDTPIQLRVPISAVAKNAEGSSSPSIAIQAPAADGVAAAAAAQQQPEEALVFANEVRVRTGLVKQQEAKAVCELPYHSVNLKYNSMGYVYEDTWNISDTRPIISKFLSKEDYTKFNNEAKPKVEEAPIKDQSAADQSTPLDKKEEPRKQQQQQAAEEQQEEEEENMEEDQIDRSDWLGRALTNQPCIQELRERLYPLHRSIAFGAAFDAGLREVKDALSDNHVLNIILQHLTFEGLRNTKKQLEEESGYSYKWIDIDQSLLFAIAKEAMRKTEKLYDLVLCDKIPLKFRQRERQAIMKDIDENLAELGIEEENAAGGENNRLASADVDIWEEDESIKQQQLITEVDPVSGVEHLHAGSLNTLIERLTSPSVDGNEHKEQQRFIQAFLTTYQSFTTPENFLNKLIQRFNVPKGIMTEHEYQSKRAGIQAAVTNVLKLLIEQHYSHLDNKLLMRIQTFLVEIAKQPTLQKIAAQLNQTILQNRSAANEQAELVDAITAAAAPPPKVNMASIFSPNLFILDCEEEEIARQMTLIEYQYFKNIQEQELLCQAWQKTKLKHRAPNVLKMMAHFDDVSMWAASIVCLGKTVYERKHRLKKVIKVCECLKNLNNFNTLKAILNGIQNPAVQRMKETKEKLAPASHRALNDLLFLMTNNNNNFQPYRDALRQAKGTCIPFIYVNLLDLSFIEDGNSDLQKHNNHLLINWAKRDMIYEVIAEIKKYQQRNYNFIRIYQVAIRLEQMEGKAKTHQELMEFSWRSEPPLGASAQQMMLSQQFSQQAQPQQHMMDDDD